MYLASDQAHPTPGGGSCRVRVYLPEDPQDAWVVLCSELLINRGASITHTVEKIAAEVLVAHDQPRHRGGLVPALVPPALGDAVQRDRKASSRPSRALDAHAQLPSQTAAAARRLIAPFACPVDVSSYTAAPRATQRSGSYSMRTRAYAPEESSKARRLPPPSFRHSLP